jgi:hypothetical protein
MMPVVDQSQETFRETEPPVALVTGHRKLSLSNRLALRVRTDHESVGNLKGLQESEFL